MSALGDFVWQGLVNLDRAVNRLFRGRWETISSRCHRRIWTKGCRLCGWLCNKLHQIDPFHCREAYHNDIANNPRIPRID